MPIDPRTGEQTYEVPWLWDSGSQRDVVYPDRQVDLGTYNPNRIMPPGWDKEWYGVAPGVTIDPNQYNLDAEGQRSYEYLQELERTLAGRDPSRFWIDPNELALRDTVTVDPTSMFDPTRASLDSAQGLTSRASNIAGTDLERAAGLQRSAALGEGPLAADLRLGADQAALMRQQAALAASARGSSGAALAALRAMNQGAAGSAQLMEEANISRVNEMNQARQGYANTAAAIRDGNLTSAQLAAQLAGYNYNVDNAMLGQHAANMDALNTATNSNVTDQNALMETNIKRMQEQQQFDDQQRLEAHRGLAGYAQDNRTGRAAAEEAFSTATNQQADRIADLADSAANRAANVNIENRRNRYSTGTALVGGASGALGAGAAAWIGKK